MDETERAREAGTVLDNRAFTEAVDTLHSRYVSLWEMEEDPDKREALWHRARALKDVLGQLRAFRDDGTVAQARQERRDARDK